LIEQQKQIEMCAQKITKRKEEFDKSINDFHVEQVMPNSDHHAVQRKRVFQICDASPSEITQTDLLFLKNYLLQAEENISENKVRLENEVRAIKEHSSTQTRDFFLQIEILVAMMKEQQHMALKQLEKFKTENFAYQRALEEIGQIVTAVAKGDLSQSVVINCNEQHSEIETFKKTINTMIGLLQNFSSEVSRVAYEVGTKGQLGGQAQIDGTQGTWKELTENGK
jgi:osomolarity two-component system sensor histidine kinase NIK1